MCIVISNRKLQQKFRKITQVHRGSTYVYNFKQFKKWLFKKNMFSFCIIFNVIKVIKFKFNILNF